MNIKCNEIRLCKNNSVDAICIPAVKEIIEKKWEKMGYPYFQLSFLLHSIICFMVTLISIFINATPHKYSIYPTEVIADILYGIVSFIFFILFLQLIFNAIVFDMHWFSNRFRGIVRYDEEVRICKIISFVSFSKFLHLNYRSIDSYK